MAARARRPRMMGARRVIVAAVPRAVGAACDGRRIAAAARSLPVLVVAGTALCVGPGRPCRADAEVMVYITVPVDSGAGARPYCGLRLDRHPTPGILGNSAASPFTRRAVFDLQMNAETALRLQVDRILSYDFRRGEWTASARDGRPLIPGQPLDMDDFTAPGPLPEPAAAQLPGTGVAQSVTAPGPAASWLQRAAPELTPRDAFALDAAARASIPRASAPARARAMRGDDMAAHVREPRGLGR